MHLTQSLGAIEQQHAEPRATALHRELAGKIRATLEEHPEQLELCLERLRYLVLSDRVGFYLKVTAEWEAGGVVLRGEAERREFKDITRGVFEQLGFTSVVDRIGIVPDLAIQPEPFGVVISPHSLTWSEPDLKGEPMDEALYGEPVYVLKEEAGAILIKTLTGYWGYARRDSVRWVDKGTFIGLLNGEKVLLLEDRRVEEMTLPSGCRLNLIEWGEGTQCKAQSVTGETLILPKSVCRRVDRDRQMAELVEYARSFLASPYNLGGKNRELGIDCSGLIQLSYRTLGINLPRDAKQQYLGGHLILPCVSEALLPGDALFFMNEGGLVDHVALYIGNREVLHATGDAVRVDSLNPEATNYLRRFEHDFIGAKRFWR